MLIIDEIFDNYTQLRQSYLQLSNGIQELC